MKDSIKVILFSLIVALSMNALDMFFHYLTNTAVHIGYVTIKLVIIFISTYLISQFVGISTRDGIVASIFGPFIFWIYYLWAYPTLDRTVFRLDEQFYFIFAHVVMMFIAYFSAYWLIVKENLNKICFFITSIFTLLAINLLYFMINLKIQSIPDADATNMIVFMDALKMLLIFIVSIGLVVLFLHKNKFSGLISGILAAIGSYLFLNSQNATGNLTHAIFVFIVINLLFYAIKIIGSKNVKN
jgi:hypothetical protein